MTVSRRSRQCRPGREPWSMQRSPSPRYCRPLACRISGIPARSGWASLAKPRLQQGSAQLLFALRPKTKPRHIARKLEHQPLADHPERRAPINPTDTRVAGFATVTNSDRRALPGAIGGVQVGYNWQAGLWLL